MLNNGSFAKAKEKLEQMIKEAYPRNLFMVEKVFKV